MNIKIRRVLRTIEPKLIKKLTSTSVDKNYTVPIKENLMA